MLKQAVENYVALRRATGFKFYSSHKLLRSFAAFATDREEEVVRAATAIAWAEQTSSPRQRYKRLRAVVDFALFLRVEDARHEIPPRNLFCARTERPVPYIFSQEEIGSIVASAAELGPRGSLRPLVFSTLFGLMAVAGLRTSEAVNLRIDDFANEGLLIRETKFRKTRFVPLHDSTVVVLKRYLEARQRLATESAHLFVTLRKPRQLGIHYVLEIFHEVCEHAGIGRTPAGERPRLHDLRHTCAARALERCPSGREQINRHMLALTTFLGHARVESTYWYLERTPRLLRDIAAACEAAVEQGAA